MVVYRLLGSGVTDANGVASVNYTGAGAGEMDFIASTSNPIDDSSLVSETYELIDTLYHDEMTSDTTSRYGVYSTMSISFDGDKIKISRISDGGGYAEYGVNSAGCDIYKGETIKFECDIVNATDNCNLAIYSDGVSSMSSSTTDGHLETTCAIGSNATYIRFRIVTNNLGTNGTCSFRNIKIYPI